MAAPKTLSLAKPLLMMVVGAPGAGKSFFARQFSEMFSAPRVSIDNLRFELFGDPSYSQNEEDLLRRLCRLIMDEIAKTNRSFIVDGYCNSRKERLAFNAFARKNGYDTLVVWVQTDPLTANQRALKRNPKKPDDVHNYSLTKQQLEKLTKQFTAPDIKEAYVVISGRHTFATQAKTVLRRLATPHEAAVDQAHSNTVQAVRRTPRPTSIGNRPAGSRSVIIR